MPMQNIRHAACFYRF